MKQSHKRRGQEAFNVFELVAVIAIIGLLVATFMLPKKVTPRTIDRIRGGYAGRCINNQKQITEAFLSAAKDRDDEYLWVPRGGNKESVANEHASSQFQALSNYITDITVVLCPTDRMRVPSSNFATLKDTNISYFVNVDAYKGTNGGYIILAGDRNLTVGTNAVTPGLFVYTNGMAMSWSRELHANSPMAPAGTISFADGHQERIPGSNFGLTYVFARQKQANTRLLIP